MEQYFHAILEGYRSETEVSEELLDQLQLFIDMVLIENIVDEFECCAREGEEVDYLMSDEFRNSINTMEKES